MTFYFEFPEEGTEVIVGNTEDCEKLFCVPAYGIHDNCYITPIGLLEMAQHAVVTPDSWVYDPRTPPYFFNITQWREYFARPCNLDD